MEQHDVRAMMKRHYVRARSGTQFINLYHKNCDKPEVHGVHVLFTGEADDRAVCGGYSWSNHFLAALVSVCNNPELHDWHLWSRMGDGSKKIESVVCTGIPASERGDGGFPVGSPDRISIEAFTAHATITNDGDPLPEATQYMIETLLPELGKKLLIDGRHYGGSNHHILGTRGQFAEIWRKLGPLKNQMWDGKGSTREDTRTILMDLIGHCLLAVEMIDNKVPEDGTWL